MTNATQRTTDGKRRAPTAIGVTLLAGSIIGCGGERAGVEADASADAAPTDGSRSDGGRKDGATLHDAAVGDAGRPGDGAADASVDGGSPEHCRGFAFIAFEREDKEGTWVTTVRADSGGEVSVVAEPAHIADSAHATDIATAPDGSAMVVALKRDPPAVVLLSPDEDCTPRVDDRLSFPDDGPPTGIGFGRGGRVLVSAFRNPLGPDDAAVVEVLEITGEAMLKRTRELTIREDDTNVSSDPFAVLASAADAGRAVVPNSWDGEDRLTLIEWDDADGRYATRGARPAELTGYKAAAISRDGTRALVTESGRIASFPIDGDGLGSPETLSMDGTPSSIAFVPGSRHALVTAYHAHEVRLVRLDGAPLAAEISAQTGPERQENPDDIAVSPFGDAALVANRLGHDVALVRVETTGDGSLRYVEDLALGAPVANAPIRLAFLR